MMRSDIFITLTIVWSWYADALVHQGCWNMSDVDDEMAFQMSPGLVLPQNISVEDCVLSCSLWNENHAGIRDGRHCLCDIQLPSMEQSSSSQCTTPCLDLVNSCGAEGLLVVYAASEALESIELQIELLTELLSPLQTDVMLSFHPANQSGVVYEIDTGNDLQEVNSSYSLRHALFVPGQHIIRGRVTDSQSNQMADKVAAANVEGQMLGLNATIDCGNDVIGISKPLLCDVTLYSGTSVHVSSSTGDSWLIEGSQYSVVELAVPPDVNVSKASVADPVSISMSEAGKPGYVSAFFIHGTSAGVVDIQIWKPDCADYCYWTNSCNESNCTNEQQNCGLQVEDSMCLLEGECCNSSSPYRTNHSFPWQQIYTTSVNLTVGPQVVTLDTAVQVELGYVIGVSKAIGTPAILSQSHTVQALLSVPIKVTIQQDPPHNLGSNQIGVTVVDTTTNDQIDLFLNYTGISAPESPRVQQLELSPEAKIFLYDTLNISFTVKCLYNASCHVMLGDSIIQPTFYFAECTAGCDGVTNATVTDVSQPISVTVTCYNGYGTSNKSVTASTVNPADDINLVHSVIQSDMEATILFSLPAEAMNSSVQVYIEGSSTPLSVIYNQTTALYSIISPPLNYGVYQLTITALVAGRPVSVEHTFYSLDAIKGLASTTPYGKLSPESSLKITQLSFEEALTTGFNISIDVLSGSNLTLNIDWGDGSIEPITSLPAELNHVYVTGGDYKVTVIASSPLRKTVTLSADLVIITPIPNDLELLAISDYYTDTDSLAVLYKVVDKNFGNPPFLHVPNHVTMVINGGDGNHITISSARLNTVYVYEYDNAVSVNVTAVLTNPIGQSIAVHMWKEMMWPIIDLYLEVIPKHAVVNKPINISVSMLKGDYVNITWNFGDGSSPIAISNGVQLTSNVQSHTYTAVGSFVASIIAANPMGATTMTYDIYVQKPVLPGMFTVSTNAPVVFPDILEVTVLYNGIPVEYPTSLTIMVDYGDGHFIEEELLQLANRSTSYSMNFSSPGIYVGFVKLHNLASSIEFPLQMNSVELIKNVSMKVLWQPKAPKNAAPRLGLGSNSDVFPLNFPIIYHVKVAKGAPIVYEVYTEYVQTGMVDVVTYSKTPITVNMIEAGVYNVTVKAVNELSSQSVSKLFTMQASTDLSESSIMYVKFGHNNSLVPSSTTTVPGEPKLFSVNLKSKCMDCCLTVDFGDGSPVEYFSSYKIVNNTFCGAGISDVKPITIPLILNHTYIEQGAYDLSLTLDNPFTGRKMVTKTFAISKRDCHQPELFIENQRDSYLDAEKRYKSALSSTHAHTILVCSDTLVNSKMWKAYLLEDESGEIIEDIDLSVLSTYTTAQLVLPPMFLDYGLYELKYMVSMSHGADGVPFSANASTFIQIVRSNLVTRMVYGGLSAVKRGMNQIILLEADRFTIDPDLPMNEPANLIAFEWFCRRVGELLPVNPVDGKLLRHPIHRVRNAREVTPDAGGCYGEGPGRLDLHTGAVRVNSSFLLPGMHYEFVVMVTSSDYRMGTASLQVEIVEESELPVVAIRCAEGGVCKQVTGGQQVNPTNNLGLYAQCLISNCRFPRYHWTVWYMDEFQFWMKIPNAEQYIRGIYGKESQGIGISESLFANHPKVDQFQFSLSFEVLSGNNGTQTGFASLNVFVNDPPYGGSCSISPKYVSSSDIPFYISCKNWLDDHGIKQYEVYASYGNTTTLLHYNKYLQDTELRLPYGYPHEDFLLAIDIRVVDVDKSYTMWSLGQVRVERGTMLQVYHDIYTLFDDTHGLDVVLQGGEIKQVSMEVLRKGALLDELSSLMAAALLQDSSELRFDSNYQSDWGSYDIFEIRNLLNVTHNTTSEEAWQIYQEFRNKISKIRTTMMSSLNKMGTGSVESLTLVSSALQSVTVASPELTRDSQESSLLLTERMVEQMLERTADSTQEELIQVATSLLYSIDNVFQGSVTQLLEPIPSDYDKSRLLWEYDTDLESDEPWVDTGDTIDQTLDNLQDFTNSKLQKQTSRSVVSKGLESVEKITKAVLNNKVPGDHPIEVERANLYVLIYKELASRLSNRTFSSGRAVAHVPIFCELLLQHCTEKEDSSSEKVISLSNVVLKNNPFLYESLMQDFKQSNIQHSTSVSKSSAAILLDYFNEEGEKLPITQTLSPVRLLLPHQYTSDANGTRFTRKTVPNSRLNILVSEIISVQAVNISLVVEFTNVTDYDYLLVFVRYDKKPDLSTNTYDVKYLVDVKGAPLQGEHMGCYRDGTPSAIQGARVFTVRSSRRVEMCLEICSAHGFRFAGLQPEDECHCGNELDTDEQVDAGECDIPCSSLKEQSCGGKERNSVYSTGIDDEGYSSVITVNQSIVQGRTGNFYVSFAPLPVGVSSIDGVTDYGKVLVANATFEYSVRANTIGCYFYDERTGSMSSEGCTVGAQSTESSIECFCNHLTTFASGFLIAPNTIDFTSLDFDPTKNPVIYITLGIITALYTILAVWARRADRKDLRKLGCIPMNSNDPLDKYLYEVRVTTGSRNGAGTKSNVYLVVCGDLDETDVRPLNGGRREILKRGQTDSFLMAVPCPLGQLQYIRVWHDNSGPSDSGSWFLNYIVLMDLQTREKYYFVANRWLAVEEGNGEIDKVIPVAADTDLLSFSHLFTETTKKDLADDHLWLSVFTRPAYSRFTRLQRVSCCLLLLMLSMVTSAMFYEKDGVQSVGVEIGPFSLSAQEVAIGFYSNLIVFAVSVLVIQLFRRSRLRRKRRSPLNLAISVNQARNQSAYPYQQGYRSRSKLTQGRHNVTNDDTNSARNKHVQRRKQFMFPWWCRVIAWLLLWMAVVTCAVFVFLYSIDFGNRKTSKWLTSMVISFLSSVLVTQPVKVVIMAIVFALLTKNPDIDDEQLDDEEELQLEYDEEWVNYSTPSYKPLRPMHNRGIRPLNQKILASLREERLKEVKMYAVLREVLLYTLFLTILATISSDNSHKHSYLFKKHMEDVFVREGDRFFQDFTRIRNVSNFWYWTRETLIPGLRAAPWYNGQPPVNLRGFLKDATSRIMGYAIIRQLRMPPNTCGISEKLVNIVSKCIGKYKLQDEEKSDFGPGWTPNRVNAANYSEFLYRTANELDGFPFLGEISLYNGGGYVFELRGTPQSLIEKAKELEKKTWIDRNTRAIFIEFTVYNVGTNLFSINTLLLEMPDSGSFNPRWRFNPMRLLHYVGPQAVFQICCHIIFALFIIGFVVTESRYIKRAGKAYFKEYWNVHEWVIIILALLGVVLYIVQYVQVAKLTNRFKETKGNTYMKFDYVAAQCELYGQVVGLLVFFTIIKLIKMFRFNKKMSLLSETLMHCGRKLAIFSIIFMIVFFSFVQFFHIILMADMLSFVTFIRSWETCFGMMLGRFDFQKMTRSNPLSPIFFILFMVVNMFILLNMLLSIVIESFSAIKNDATKQTNEYEIVNYMLGRFKSWTGLAKSTDNFTLNPGELMSEESDSEELSDQAGQFSTRVDVLLSSLKKCYAESHMVSDVESILYEQLVGRARGKLQSARQPMEPY